MWNGSPNDGEFGVTGDHFIPRDKHVFLGDLGLGMPARDADGYLRLLDMGELPLPDEIRRYHRERLEHAAKSAGKAFGPDLAIDSVYELSEDIGALLPAGWAG